MRRGRAESNDQTAGNGRKVGLNVSGVSLPGPPLSDGDKDFTTMAAWNARQIVASPPRRLKDEPGQPAPASATSPPEVHFNLFGKIQPRGATTKKRMMVANQGETTVMRRGICHLGVGQPFRRLLMEAVSAASPTIPSAWHKSRKRLSTVVGLYSLKRQPLLRTIL